MSGTLNRVMLIGRLTRDPEMRYTSSGQAVTSFALATDRWGGGEDGKKADFHDCVAWNSGKRNLAELVGNSCHKGSLVYVEGRLQTRSWETNDGQKRKATEVVVNDVQFLDSKREGQGSQRSDRDAPDLDDVPF